MQPAGCTLRETMGKRTRRLQGPRKAHIRYEAITTGTIHRYEVAILRFFQFLRLHDRVYPATLAELDVEVSEFINHLYQDDSPLYWATYLVCGFKRFYPKCKRHLDTSSQYLNNWTRAVRRTRALPLPADACLAMASISLLWGWPRFGLSLLLGFLGLLRTGEILSIMKKQVSILGGGSLLVIALPNSKGAKRKGRPEYVRIHDTEVIRAVALLLGSLSPDERLFPGGFRQFSQLLEATAKAIGIAHPNLTPYTLRRGGATWHFSTFLSYDATQEHGRWHHRTTAKIYIDQATAEMSEVAIPADKQKVLECAIRVLPALLRDPLQTPRLSPAPVPPNPIRPRH